MLRRLLQDRDKLRWRLPFVDADKLQGVNATVDQYLEMLSATEEEVEEVDIFADVLLCSAASPDRSAPAVRLPYRSHPAFPSRYPAIYDVLLRRSGGAGPMGWEEATGQG